jgi:hypothetical protein
MGYARIYGIAFYAGNFPHTQIEVICVKNGCMQLFPQILDFLSPKKHFMPKITYPELFTA